MAIEVGSVWKCPGVDVLVRVLEGQRVECIHADGPDHGWKVGMVDSFEGCEFPDTDGPRSWEGPLPTSIPISLKRRPALDANLIIARVHIIGAIEGLASSRSNSSIECLAQGMLTAAQVAVEGAMKLLGVKAS